MKKSILIDASSAILLFKSGWMAPLMEHYRVETGPAAFREMTVADYRGASAFRQWQQEERLVLHPQCPPTVSVGTDRNLSLIHISEPTRQLMSSRMPSSA